MHRIYLDHNASTPVDPAVIQAMVQVLQEESGNPSSVHVEGQKARRRLEQCRQTIASFLKVKPNEIIFTSGGTEGANLLIKGLFRDHSKGHIISSDVEHSCIYETLRDLEAKGTGVSFLHAGLWGAVQPDQVRQAIRPSTKLITLMAVNNETGVKTDIEAIAAIAQEHNIPLIVDGVALLGKELFSIPRGVSAMFFSGHKFHAPKGTGFVFIRSSLKISPLLIGGSQELGRRAGTENLSGIVGLAAAIEILSRHQETITQELRQRRDQLEQGIIQTIPHIVINGIGPRVANVSNLSFLDVDGEALLMMLDLEGLAVSHGSACSSGAIEPSRVLMNMGMPSKQARSAIRFSVSRQTTSEDIARSLEIIIKVIDKLKKGKKSL